jgi:hypothetical protein
MMTSTIKRCFCVIPISISTDSRSLATDFRNASHVQHVSGAESNTKQADRNSLTGSTCSMVGRQPQPP